MRHFVCVVALCALGSSAVGNMLINGNLDSPGTSGSDAIDGWTLTETLGFNAAEFADIANHTPGGATGLWLRPWAGKSGIANIPVDARLEQTVSGIVPGARYRVSAWLLFDEYFEPFKPASVGFASLRMQWLDAEDNVLSGVFYGGLNDSDSGFNDGAWRQFVLESNAPADAVAVAVTYWMRNGIDSDQDPQSAYADDFVLEQVPAPGTLGVLALAGSGAARRRRRR